MPGGDGTGPAGQGPMTGRAAGFCAGFNAPGYANPMPRARRFFRRGFGRGLRRWNITPVMQPAPVEQIVPVATKKEEIQYLEEEQKLIKQELQEIEKRLKEIKKEKDAKT